MVGGQLGPTRQSTKASLGGGNAIKPARDRVTPRQLSRIWTARTCPNDGPDAVTTSCGSRERPPASRTASGAAQAPVHHHWPVDLEGPARRSARGHDESVRKRIRSWDG